MKNQEIFDECPKCKSENISSGSFESDEYQAYREVTCEKCGFTWREIFDFSFNETMDGMLIDNPEIS